MLIPLAIALMISFVSMEALPSEAGLRAIDGDTLALGPERIRVVGLDAPEMPTHAACNREGRAGLAARNFVAATLDAARTIELQRQGKDRYRRTLARVMVDGQDLAEIAIAAGHGRAYDGRGPRQRWCRR